MSDSKTLPIPSSDQVNMKKKDSLTIRVTQTCQWCYSDPNGVFPTFLAAGQVQPGDYGPYTAENTGTVLYGCPTSGNCTPGASITATGHTITVTN